MTLSFFMSIDETLQGSKQKVTKVSSLVKTGFDKFMLIVFIGDSYHEMSIYHLL